MSRLSQAFAYCTSQPRMSDVEARRDLVGIDSLYDLKAARRRYRASQGLYEETNPDEFDIRPPPSQRMAAIGDADPRRLVDVLTDTDRDY